MALLWFTLPSMACKAFIQSTQAFSAASTSRKKARFSARLSEWMLPNRHHIPHRSGTKRDLLSLTGLLSYACKVVRPGCPFIHSHIDAATSLRFMDTSRQRCNAVRRE